MKFIIRMIFSLILIILMWLGNKYALYLNVTLCFIGIEAIGIILNKWIENERK